jgi:hypothetical protein
MCRDRAFRPERAGVSRPRELGRAVGFEPFDKGAAEIIASTRLEEF